MADYTISCDTFVRLASVIKPENNGGNEWFGTVRIDRGIAVATCSKFMACERVPYVDGVIHIIPTAALLAQCVVEAQFNSSLTITYVEALGFGVAKTTLGYIEPGNCLLLTSQSPRVFDGWREIVAQVKEPAAQSQGGMLWNCDGLLRLMNSSPSKHVVFEQNIDINRPTLMTDYIDPNWFGLFNAWYAEKDHSPALLPGWAL